VLKTIDQWPRAIPRGFFARKRGIAFLIRACVVLLVVVACVNVTGCATAELAPTDAALVAGKTYVITGASSGFGRGVALRLAALHANVVLAARRADALEEVARQASASGGAALAVPTDVARADDVQRLADRAVARFGRIDVWIDDAGRGAIGRFDDVPLAPPTPGGLRAPIAAGTTGGGGVRARMQREDDERDAAPAVR